MDEEEFAIEIADAIEQCLDVETVECNPETSVILVTTGEGERFRITVAHIKARPKNREDEDDDDEGEES
jgi:hypothetical protein